ncbi:MAG: group II intron maturase-specific domain-containing protein, partial [Actinomycetota bacterium]
AVVDGLNRVLRAWGNHFRYGNSTAKFSAIDRYVHERLAIFMSVKHGLAGSKHRHMGRFDHRWFSSLGVYRLAGTVRYGTAHAGR